MRRILLLGTVMMVLSGCAGTIQTYTSPADVCVKTATGCRYDGVLHRPLKTHEQSFLHDRILDKEGKLTHHVQGDTGKRCTPVTVTETTLIPDPNKEYLITYEPAFFESSKFGVELTANGTLAKVSSESTPGGKALVESLVSIVTTRQSILSPTTSPPGASAILGTVDRSKDPFCSHGKLFVSP